MEAEVREMMERARQQSNEFMFQAREQARQQMAYQQQQMTASFSVAGGSGGGGGAPSPGTPAGRLMETITGLIQRGATMGGGAATGAFGAGMGQVGALGGMAGAFAAAPIDLGGAMFTTQQRNMRFMQTLAAAVPIGFGAQRMDMTSGQASAMAREELGARWSRGWRAGLSGTASAASFGLFGYSMRLHGLEQAWTGREDIAAGLQQQGRYVRRSALEEAGMGDIAGPFPTGVTRAGARDLAKQMSENIYAPMQRQYGLTGSEMSVVTARAAGTMGRQSMEDVFTGKRGAMQNLGKQTRSVIEVQQMLNLSTEEADQFWGMVGQMHGTAEKIAQKARQARRMGGALGMGPREVMQTMMDFERMGIQTGMGGDRARAVAENYTQSVYETFRRGGISSQQMMRYGGNTPEEGMRLMAQARFQENIGAWGGGAGLMGTGVLTGTPGWGKLMGGQMGFMETMGAVGQEMVRDPFAMQRRRFDPAAQQAIGMSADRAAYNLIKKMPTIGTKEQARVQQMMAFKELMPSLSDLDVSARFSQYEGEKAVAAALMGSGARPGAAEEVASIYSEMVGTGMAAPAAQMLGSGSVWEAAKKIHDINTNSGKKDYDPSRSLISILSETSKVGAFDARTSRTFIESIVGGGSAFLSMRKGSGQKSRGDSIAAIEMIGKAVTGQAKNAGRLLSSMELNRAVFENTAGLLLTNEREINTRTGRTTRTEEAKVGFDEGGNLVLVSTNVDDLQDKLGQRVEDLKGESAMRRLMKMNAGLFGGTSDANALKDWVSSIGGGTDVARRATEAIAAAPGQSRASFEKILFSKSAGVASAMFGMIGGDLPMTKFLQRVKGMASDPALMAKAGQLGLTGLTTFATAMQGVSGESSEERIKQALLSIGTETLAPALGKSAEDVQKMLDKGKGLKDLFRSGDIQVKILESVMRNIDTSKFNAFGSSESMPMHVEITKNSIVSMLRARVGQILGTNEKEGK